MNKHNYLQKTIIMNTKTILFILFIFYAPFNISAQALHKQISGLDYVFKNEKVTDCREIECQQLNVYRDGQTVLSHPLLRRSGDSNSEAYEIGNYKIHEDKIYFYTMWVYWSKPNNIPYKYGFQKKVYKVISDETIQLLSSEITLVDAFRVDPSNKKYFTEPNPNIHQGSKYVFSRPKTDYEKAALEDYINMIEQDYESNFIHGKNQWKLEREVRLAIKDKHHEITKDWNPKNKEKYGFVNK